MHELSVAQNIADAIASEAMKNGASAVREVDIELGELMQLDREALEMMLKVTMSGPMFKGTVLRLSVAEASFSCRRCGGRWGMDEVKKQLASVSPDLLVREPDSNELPLHFLPYLYPAFVRCPLCGSSDTSADRGEEIDLKRLVLE